MSLTGPQLSTARAGPVAHVTPGAVARGPRLLGVHVWVWWTAAMAAAALWSGACGTSA